MAGAGCRGQSGAAMKTIAVLASVLALVVTASAVEVSCSDGYILIGNTTCLYFSSDKATWFDAEFACKSKGGDLAAIRDCHLMSSVWAYVAYHLELREDFWLGGRDIFTDGNWQWVTDLTPVPTGVPYWFPGQPDGADEYALVFSKDGFFADAHADQEYRYICQYDS